MKSLKMKTGNKHRNYFLLVFFTVINNNDSGIKLLKRITEVSLMMTLLLAISLAFAVPSMMGKPLTKGWLKEPSGDKDDKTLSPYFFVKSDNPSVDQLPLKETKADVNIAGVIADVKVTQVYCNSGKNPLEAIYIFPASTRAAVYDMRMTVGDRLLIAKIQEKEQARKDYDQAKADGKSASLLEQERPNVFQMNVANIMPGDTIKVEMRYTELLVPEEGVYEFDYPTVVGPRYSNKSDATAAADDKWVSNPYTHAGDKPSYSFDINTRLVAGMSIKDVKSPSHEVNINYENKSTAVIKLKETEKFSGNKDYILQYRLADNTIESGLLLYKGEKENFFLTMIQSPARPTADQIPPREYIFIMDVSGSMSGYPLETSKKLLKNLVSNLRSTDVFNVMMFAGGSTTLSDHSIAATPANLDKAINVIENQQGGGGTELLPALKKALSLPKEEGFSRSFVIATDGYVDVEKESFQLIHDNLNKANFFAFGIGTSVNRYIIEGMAHVGMGEPFVITNEADAESKAEQFRKYIQTPVLTNIKVSYSGFDVYDVEPVNIPDVLAARPIIIFGKYKGEAKGSITLSGNSGKSDYTTTIDVGNSTATSSNSALKYLWVRQKIRNLDDFNCFGEDPKIKEEITSLGLKYNLLTNYTSFIAIDSVIRNKTGKQVTVKQPLPLPDKVSDYAVGGYSGNAMGSTSVKCCEMKCVSVQDVSGDPLHIASTSPEFKGGETAMENFIKSNLKYPEEAKNAGISGKVIISFTVEANGEITNIKVLKGIGHGCDEEAIRVVKLMSKMFTPGTQNGSAVADKFRLPIKFVLTK